MNTAILNYVQRQLHPFGIEFVYNKTKNHIKLNQESFFKTEEYILFSRYQTTPIWPTELKYFRENISDYHVDDINEEFLIICGIIDENTFVNPYEFEHETNSFIITKNSDKFIEWVYEAICKHEEKYEINI